MDLGALRTLALDLNVSAHGVDVTVQLPDASAAIDTRGIWLTTDFAESPIGADWPRHTARRTLVLTRAAVPAIPIGTIVVAPERPGIDPTRWRVDGYDMQRADHHRVTVVPLADETVDGSPYWNAIPVNERP